MTVCTQCGKENIPIIPPSDKCPHEYESQLAAALDEIKKDNELFKKMDAREKRLREALEAYGNHQSNCATGIFEAGEPIPGGGYRQKISGKWYQVKPIDESPKCDCGLQSAIDRTC